MAQDHKPVWQDVAETCQARRAAALPAEWTLPASVLTTAPRNVLPLIPQFLSARENEITNLTASELAAAIRARTYTSLEVTRAFCHRAAVGHQFTNCLTEVFFEAGLAQARELDDILEKTGKPVGPLHGVPVSIKDQWNIAGQYTTAGYIAYASAPRKEEDAHVVEILRNAGAVFYAKTNNPQCMMVLETVSNVFGRTLNPNNKALGCGGSTGGEGCLLALRGSPLGLGGDIGGSIRVPAAFNGIYGFKPSAKRVPMSGLECTNTGPEHIMAVAGPLGHSIEDLELFQQIVSDAEPWLREPLLEMPWKRERLVEEKLAVGIMVWDEVVMPHPYITRVIKETAEKLKAAGHDVIEFRPLEQKKVWDEIILPLYFTDGGLDIKQTLAAGGEEMFPSAKKIIDDPIVRERTIHEIWKLNIARDDYKMKYMAHWNETAKQTASGRMIDVLICPVSPVQGTPHDVKPWWGYCSQWNLLDYPGGVMPAGKALESDKYPDGYEPINELDKENYELYDVDLYKGMPVTIQVVGRTQQDEKVIQAMKIIDKVLKG